MYWRILTMYMVYFYTDVLGITAAAAGTVILVTRIWDTANDPIMGIIADRTNSRYGKFRPYILYGSIPLAAMGVLTFTAPDLGYTGKIIWAFSTYTIMMMVYTVVNVPYGALLGVMSPNPRERTILGSYRFVAAFAGGILVVSLAEPLVAYFQSLELGPGTESFGWQMTLLFFGILAVVFLLYNFYNTRERIEPPKHHNKLKDDLRDLINNKPWLLLLGAGVTVLIFNSIRDGTIVFYFRYFVDTNGAELDFLFFNITYPLSSLFMVLGQAANLIGVAFSSIVALKLGRKYTFIGCMAVATMFSFLFYFLSDSDIVLMFVYQIIISFCAGMVLPILLSMYGDAADYNEWINGRRATGLVFSTYSTSQKFGFAFGSASIGYMLAWFGYEAGVEQTEDTLMGIQAMMSFIPAIGAILAGLFMLFYRLDDERMKTVTSKLEAKRNNKPKDIR